MDGNAQDRAGYLLFFDVGGAGFAAEATSVEDVAGGDWTPPADSQYEERKGRVVKMAELLNLPVRKGKRTLVVETLNGPLGFVVDSISKAEITVHEIVPVPQILRDWMKPEAVSGFCLDEETIFGILDLQRLAEMLPGDDGAR